MTPRDLVTTILSQGPASSTLALEMRLIFRVLRDNLHVIELKDGGRVSDLSDMRALCLECVEVLTPQPTCIQGRGPKTLRPEQPRNWSETT